MTNQSFAFKQFSIAQDRCAMKVGTDGVLLGAWCLPAESRSILDIGAGTGLISLMLAQRFPEARIDAIEIDPEAAGQCRENIEASPWHERIRLHPLSLQDFRESTSSSPQQYDLIVSNPPFYNATLKPDDLGRALARHKDSLPVSDIVQFAGERLSPVGSLALIFPRDYEAELMTQFALSPLHLQRICDIVSREGKAPKRRMVQLGRAASQCLEARSLFIRDTDNAYTQEYRELTDPFYISLK